MLEALGLEGLPNDEFREDRLADASLLPGTSEDWPAIYRRIRIASAQGWTDQNVASVGAAPMTLGTVVRALGMSREEFSAWVLDASEAEVRAGLTDKEYRWKFRQDLDCLGQAPSDEPVTMLSPSEALGYLDRTGWRPERVVAGFERTDVLLYSRLDPERFCGGRSLNVPQMLWRLDNGRWIGVRNVNVGYGGTGPSNAYDLLTKAGIRHSIANSARRHRFFDLDLKDSENPTHREAETTDLFGLKQLPQPEGGAVVVKLSREDLRCTDEHERQIPHLSHYAFNKDGLTEYEAWIKYLNSANLPAWLKGPRTGKLFTSYEAAHEQGFAGDLNSALSGRCDSVYPLVIEQGRLQLWLPVYVPLSRERLVEREAHEALGTAGLYPGYLMRPGARSSLAHYARHLRWTWRGSRRGFVDFLQHYSEG